MTTDLAERVHELVFMGSGPGPGGPSRNDNISLKQWGFWPVISWQPEGLGGGKTVIPFRSATSAITPGSVGRTRV